MNKTNFNREVFIDTTKRMVTEHGDFLNEYYKKINVDVTKIKVNYGSQNNLFRNGN
jgi:hypothetical protein